MLVRRALAIVTKVFVGRGQRRVVTGSPHGIDQSLRRHGARVIDYCGAVGDEVDSRVGYARLCLQRALHPRLAGGAGHSGYWKGDSLFRPSDRRHSTSFNESIYPPPLCQASADDLVEPQWVRDVIGVMPPLLVVIGEAPTLH